MIDIETLIVATLCLIILVLLKILSKKSIEGFEVTNDVPEENRIESNYLKKILKQVKEVFPGVCNPDPKCGDNVNESWCNKNA